MKKNKNVNSNGEIKGIILITLGILIILSLFSAASFGLVGNFMRNLFLSLFGLGSYIVPLLLIFVGCCLIIKKGKVIFNRKFYSIIFLIIAALLTLQIANINVYYNGTDFVSGIKKIYSDDTLLHGGIVIYILAVPLYKLCGYVGSIIILAVLQLILLIIIFQISLYDIFNKVITAMSLKDDKDTDETEEEAVVDDVQPSSEKSGYINEVNKKIKIIDFLKSASTNNEADVSKQAVSGNPEPSTVEDVQEINKELEKKINEHQKEEPFNYHFPPIDLLNLNSHNKLNKEDKRELISNASKLEDTLNSFGVEAKVIQVTKGPSVTRFELQPSSGVKVSKIVSLADDIALNLAAPGVRIEAPIPGKAAVGIEVPNKDLTAVLLREVIESSEFINSNRNLAVGLGKDIAGNCVVTDLCKMPHALIAGATGSGKSVCINTLIVSILYKYSPDEVKLLMIDPKVVELSIYNGIPHLLIPVVTDPKKAAGALNWAVNEMTRRYKLFADNGVRNIEGYNELFKKGKVESKLPYIVIVVDELADLMMVCPNDVEDYIGRLAQMARAAGMHLVIATQRPSVDVITGVIKANIPSRISFAVSSQIDSRTILDMAGAEKLLGKGDMLFYPVGESKPIRIQGAFISEEEVEKIVNYIKNNGEEPSYQTEILEEINTPKEDMSNEHDELLDEAIKIVMDAGQASTSLIQRRLRIGYNRAARIIEEMEQEGIISEKDGSKPRQVLAKREDYYLDDM